MKKLFCYITILLLAPIAAWPQSMDGRPSKTVSKDSVHITKDVLISRIPKGYHGDHTTLQVKGIRSGKLHFLAFTLTTPHMPAFRVTGQDKVSIKLAKDSDVILQTNQNAVSSYYGIHHRNLIRIMFLIKTEDLARLKSQKSKELTIYYHGGVIVFDEKQIDFQKLSDVTASID